MIHPWFQEQNFCNLKGFKLKSKRVSITNQNVLLTPPLGKGSPFSTPRSPRSPMTNPLKQSDYLTKIAGKKLSNFYLEDDSTPRESEYYNNTQCNFLKKVVVRKSIFNHLEPINRQRKQE